MEKLKHFTTIEFVVLESSENCLLLLASAPLDPRKLNSFKLASDGLWLSYTEPCGKGSLSTNGFVSVNQPLATIQKVILQLPSGQRTEHPVQTMGE